MQALGQQSGSLPGQFGDGPCNQVIGTAVLRLSGKVRHEPMAQHGIRELQHIVHGHVMPTVQEGPRFTAKHQLLARARSRSPVDLLRRPGQAALFAWPQRSHQIQYVLFHMIRKGHGPNHLLILEDLFARDDRLQLG